MLGDRYELQERIAVGGMAEVFRARATGAHGFEKTVAVKRILPSLASDPDFERRFIAEAKLAAALGHANVVQVIDFGRFGGSLYIAMELVDGGDLAAVLRAIPRPPVAAAMEIALGIAKGLEFAHRRGVVHRDVSPSNILLSRSGEVKIADFGIALAGSSHSSTGRIMGKWRYMSPEQARGAPVDARSDLFAAAAVMFELFTGRKLFPGDDIETTVANVTSMPIPMASSIRAELPPALDAVLARALERDPDRRWPDAGELVPALVEVSHASTLVATPRDVADLVSAALPAGAAPKEIERSSSVGRVTVPGGMTFVTKGTDLDGVTVWEAAPAPTPRRRWPIFLPLLLLPLALLAIPRKTARPVSTSIDAGLPRGRIELTTIPAGAHLSIDGTDVGTTPLTIELAPGKHDLLARLAGYRDWREPSAPVGPGERIVYRPELVPATGRLKITTVPPGAAITAGDRDLGPSPVDVELRAGPIDVRAKKPGWNDAERQATVVDAQTIELSIPLDPIKTDTVRYGTVNLYVDPWADVYVGGRKVAEAPVSGLRLPAGRQALHLVNPVQHRVLDTVVDVPDGGTRTYKLALP